MKILSSLFIKNTETDWTKHFPQSDQETTKQVLIKKCQKHKICIFKDDENENYSSDFFRPVASEAELEKRLMSWEATHNSKKANLISMLALFFSFISMAVTFYEKFL